MISMRRMTMTLALCLGAPLLGCDGSISREGADPPSHPDGLDMGEHLGADSGAPSSPDDGAPAAMPDAGLLPDMGTATEMGGGYAFVPPPLDDGPIRPTSLSDQRSVGRVGLRRLSRREADFTLGDIFQISPSSVGSLDLYPSDSGATTLFDNVYHAQSISRTEIEAFEAFAEHFTQVMVSSGNRNKLLGARGADCSPTGPDDAACLGRFLQRVGSKMLRRDVTDAERDRWVARLLPYALEDQRFDSGLEWGMRLLLQHPEFLYRVEKSSDPDVPATLDGFEIASRMAYLIWGQGPSPALLDAARQGTLSEGAERQRLAEQMLEDPRATAQFLAFHQLWLNYSVTNIPMAFAGRDDLIQETESLLLHIIEDAERPWLDIFLADETFITDTLAELYGLPSPGAQPDWVRYDGTRGGGVLAHGAYLQSGYKGGNFDDTSPTNRGYQIYLRFLCGENLATSIPDGVDETTPPVGNCKSAAYAMRETPGCQSCHIITDGIGFGLEQYGQFGELRATDQGKPDCPISGEGELMGERFSGTQQLGERLSQNNALKRCASKQLFRFMLGRPDTAEDAEFIEAMTYEQSQVGSFKKLMARLVASPAFIIKQGEKQ